jgi:hypothetical protein
MFIIFTFSKRFVQYGHRRAANQRAVRLGGVAYPKCSFVEDNTIGVQLQGDLFLNNQKFCANMQLFVNVYVFQNLQEAHLTHSFHCCAFIFPSRHDPARHAEQLRKISDQQMECIEKGYLPKVSDDTSDRSRPDSMFMVKKQFFSL